MATATLLSAACGPAVQASHRSASGFACSFHLHAGKQTGYQLAATDHSGHTRTYNFLPPGALTPGAAMQQALRHGTVPDPQLPGGWIRLKGTGTAVAYFRGQGVSPGGDVEPNQLVMGDVTSIDRLNGKWVAVATGWHYCNPRLAEPRHKEPSASPSSSFSSSYNVSFGQADGMDIAAECMQGNFASVHIINGVTHLVTRKRLQSVDLTSLQHCVAFHHGTMTKD